MLHLVKEIISIEPYKITLRFNTGEVRVIDLEANLKEWSASPQSKFAELLDFEVFKRVKLDKVFETLVWENGIDLCPDMLYKKSVDANKKNVA